MNNENFEPREGENTGKFNVHTGLDIEKIMDEVDREFASGKQTYEPRNTEESADMSDSTTRKIDARNKNN